MTGLIALALVVLILTLVILAVLESGSVSTADRLLKQCQKGNPGMKTEWYFEKVIYDLIRDRR